MKRIAIFCTVVVAAALTMGNATGTKCRFCGSSSYGSGCPYSPGGRHKHGGDGTKCVWCGSGSCGILA